MKKADNEATLNTFYAWMLEKAEAYEDGEMGMWRCLEALCEDLELPQEIADWACRRHHVESALAAGIPLEVIEGDAKLSDIFSDQYIRMMKGEDE